MNNPNNSITRYSKVYFVDAKCLLCPRRVFYTANDDMSDDDHKQNQVCDVCKSQNKHLNQETK